MSCNYGAPSTRLSYTPPDPCCASTVSTSASGTGGFSCCYEEPSCERISKLANFAMGGGGGGEARRYNNSNNCCWPQPQQCCPPPPCPCPPPRLRPIKPCCPTRPCIPPVCIQRRPVARVCGGKTPAERLRNVDVLEELCYYVPGNDPCCPPMECYNVCNCCGTSELVGCCCPEERPIPPNPVKYSRRQRFTFQNDVKCEPQWPFDRNKSCQEYSKCPKK
jgi:hypothetical protein